MDLGGPHCLVAHHMHLIIAPVSYNLSATEPWWTKEHPLVRLNSWAFEQNHSHDVRNVMDINLDILMPLFPSDECAAGPLKVDRCWRGHGKFETPLLFLRHGINSKCTVDEGNVDHNFTVRYWYNRLVLVNCFWSCNHDLLGDKVDHVGWVCCVRLVQPTSHSSSERHGELKKILRGHPNLAILELVQDLLAAPLFIEVWLVAAWIHPRPSRSRDIVYQL